MKKVFSVHVVQFPKDVTNKRGIFYNRFLSILHELRVDLEKSYNIGITISELNEETMSAVVTISERDYNKFILFKSHPFYERCKKLVVDMDKAKQRSYKMEYEAPIIWSEVDEKGEYS